MLNSKCWNERRLLRMECFSNVRNNVERSKTAHSGYLIPCETIIVSYDSSSWKSLKAKHTQVAKEAHIRQGWHLRIYQIQFLFLLHFLNPGCCKFLQLLFFFFATLPGPSSSFLNLVHELPTWFYSNLFAGLSSFPSLVSDEDQILLLNSCLALVLRSRNRAMLN